MIRVLVVEDQAPVLRRICQSIEETNQMFRVVARARNSREALAFLHEKKIDIVFLDHHMPVLNGIEVIQCIQTERIRVNVVSVGGYQEFLYFYTAMKYGVLDYLLKPIKEDELKQVLQKIEWEILKQHFLFLKDTERVEEERKDEQDKIYTVVTLQIGSVWENVEYSMQQEECMNHLKEKIAKVIIREAWCIFETKHSGEFLFVFKHYPRYVMGQLKIILKEIWSEAGWLILTFVISQEVWGIEQIQEVYIRERKALFHVREIDNYLISLLEACQTIEEENKVMTQNYLSNEKSPRTIEEFGPCVNQLLQTLPRRYIVINSILKTWLTCLSERLSDYDALLAIEEALLQIMSKRLTIEEFEEALHAMTSHVFKKHTQAKPNKEQLAEDIKTYIEDCYSQPITSQLLSERFNFASTYIGKIFKKYYGESPQKYLEKVRIDKSKQLLRQGHAISIKQVAQQIGFVDQLYFTKVFKKCVGKTPTEYRIENSVYYIE